MKLGVPGALVYTHCKPLMMGAPYFQGHHVEPVPQRREGQICDDAPMKIATLTLTTLLAAATLAAQAPDFSKVEIKTTKLAPNFYVLEGAGGATGALIGPDGVLMVDSQFAPLTT